MTRLLLNILFTSALLLCKAQQDAAAYFSKVDASLRLVQDANWQYAKAAAGSRPSKVEKERDELLQAITQAGYSLSSLPSWKNSSALRDTALMFLQISRAVATDDYGDVANLEPIAETAFDAMEAFIAARNTVERRLSMAAGAVEEEYRQFALDNDLKLATDPGFDDGMLPASQALHHYNQVYRIFFFNYKQEAYLLDAINRGDVSAIDQNREALLRSSRRGLAELEDLPPFGDNQLRTACRKLLTFYNNEANTALSDAAPYFVQRDDLQKQSHAMANLRGETPPDSVSIKMEKANEDFRKRGDSFKRSMAALSQRRQSLISSWQRTADHFVRKNVR